MKTINSAWLKMLTSCLYLYWVKLKRVAPVCENGTPNIKMLSFNANINKQVK